MNQYHYSNNELTHWGIPGMKWGIRRYQNPDGTLTEAGKRRYAINEAKENIREAKSNYKAVKKARPKFGVIASRDEKRKYDDYSNRKNEAKMNIYDAKADLRGAKRGDKAAEKYYAKKMSRTGLPGSGYDYVSGDKSTKLYDHIAVKRGEEYAKRVQKRAFKQILKTAAKTAAVTAGAYAVHSYLSRYSSWDQQRVAYVHTRDRRAQLDLPKNAINLGNRGIHITNKY